ncbi:hypothetical protein TCAL_03653 [Tigriopus californicus]|uniref:Ankyrin repeat domain-containing protein n=1 Tax=Tigriopus californicus TaxID=6832 RepID=A0A553NDF1_TIGCA|nr:ankyrin repeat domain-containing protein 13D-like [Tigriopus californicus]TRY63379.1 hypothetical protein TCAL_03653 [Tigriopus californicus]
MAEAQYPLHRLAWENKYQDLDVLLAKKQYEIEEVDPRGRTPLMLSVTLGHLESTRVLLKHNANVNVINKGGWTVVQEAVSTGDPELLQLVLEKRDSQRHSSRIGGIPDLLQKLKNAPDFYVEMKWEFTSWLPFVSRVCPSDTYKVYKQGSKVRIDTTLLGFDQSSWVRGNRTYIFSGRGDGADLYEVDHDTKTVYYEEMKLLSLEELASQVQSEGQISTRLTTPLILTYVDTDQINFERTRGGFWGWGSDKTEVVSDYECKVFGANNVELITKTRTEHLTEEDKKRAKSNKNPLQSFIGMAETEVKQAIETNSSSEFFSVTNPCCISPEEYFNSEKDLENRDIGRPKEMTRKIQKFHAQLWLSEEYPLSLQEQVMPIVDLMAISNTHFQKLKDFITCSFPSGFPVKIEIPLFRVVNARITFGNIFGLNNNVEGITVVKEEGENRTSCAVDDLVFEVPADYSRIGGQSSNQVRRQYEDEDDQLLQFAIRQSMANPNGGGGVTEGGRTVGSEQNHDSEEVDIWEALQAQGPQPQSVTFPRSQEDRQLELQIQRAIELSLSKDQGSPLDATDPGALSAEGSVPKVPGDTALNHEGGMREEEDELAMAIRLSQTTLDEEARRKNDEDEMLKKILELSMTEK